MPRFHSNVLKAFYEGFSKLIILQLFLSYKMPRYHFCLLKAYLADIIQNSTVNRISYKTEEGK